MLLLNGCALLPQPKVVAPADNAAPALLTAPADGSHYRISDAWLEIHTYRAGWLAHLAHNHVMETGEIGGDVYLTVPIENSIANLHFRPWDLRLDDPDSRAAAGPGFESVRTTADISATRTRMLGPSGFDSNNHPWVQVTVNWQSADSATLEIQLRGGTYSFSVPIDWSITDTELAATADFELSHRALGIRPYSAFAGAIAVADPIRVQLTLSARPASSL